MHPHHAAFAAPSLTLRSRYFARLVAAKNSCQEKELFTKLYEFSFLPYINKRGDTVHVSLMTDDSMRGVITNVKACERKAVVIKVPQKIYYHYLGLSFS